MLKRRKIYSHSFYMIFKKKKQDNVDIKINKFVSFQIIT
jgi:hypothetical protein